MPIHTPPPWRRSSNACTAGKSKVFQSHRTGGVAILAPGRRPRTRKAWSELISPISPAYPAASQLPASRVLEAASAALLPGRPHRGYGVLSERTCVHGQLGRLPSAKHGCPPGLGPLPESSPPTTKRHHQPNRFCCSFCSSFCSSDKLWAKHRSIRPSAKRQTWLPPGPWSTPPGASTDPQRHHQPNRFCCIGLLFGKPPSPRPLRKS